LALDVVWELRAGGGEGAMSLRCGRDWKWGLSTTASRRDVAAAGEAKSWHVRSVRLAMLSLILLGSSAGRPAARDYQWRSVDEFGLRMAFPAGARICEGLSGAHLHGWAMPIGGNCDNMRRRITVWADWNAVFLKSPRQAASCSAEGLRRGALFKLGFAGRRSITCDGGIVTVVAMAWRSPERWVNGDPGVQAPLVIYEAFLRTTRQTLDRDLAAFRRVLRLVQIRRPKGVGTAVPNDKAK
jgi:hypothetical protein